MKKFVLILSMVTLLSFCGYAKPFPTGIAGNSIYNFGVDGSRKPHHERKAHKKLRKKVKQRKVWY